MVKLSEAHAWIEIYSGTMSFKLRFRTSGLDDASHWSTGLHCQHQDVYFNKVDTG